MNSSRMNGRDEESQRLFQELKQICVPLLAKSHLAPSAIPEVSSLLTRLIEALREAQRHGPPLTPSIISYVFFPISTILRRNTTTTLPDQILEKLLIVLAILCEPWWWDMDVQTWEQLFMLCGAILGGLDSKGKEKRRDDETLEAAVDCLWALLHERSSSEEVEKRSDASRSSTVFSSFQSHSRTRPFIPIIGQTVNSLLDASTSQHLSLQRASLKLLCTVVEKFLPDDVIPSILPGLISTMCKIALATGSSKRWANGDVVALALSVTDVAVIRAIGDEICVQEGAVRRPTTLEDLVELGTDSSVQDTSSSSLPYTTKRTSSWLRGTGSQMHIALNSLNALVNHPSSTALKGLASFSTSLLRNTALTLPQSTSLLLSYLLSLSLSEYEEVSKQAKHQLVELCGDGSPSRYTILQALLQIAKDHLMHIPRLIASQSDVKVEHSAGILEAICNLAAVPDGVVDDQGLRVIAAEVSKLLGPNGGVERWGWGLLSVLDLTAPSLAVTTTSTAQLMLEGDAQATQWSSFPEIHLYQISSRSAQQALERMLCALGRAAREDGLFAVEWFFGVGKAGEDSRAVAALWCGSRLLEGIGDVSLDISQGPHILPRRRRVEKFARWLAKALPELWDDETRIMSGTAEKPTEPEVDEPEVEHVKGLVQIRAPTQVGTVKSGAKRPAPSPALHRALALQSLAVCAGVLQTGFTHLLLYTLYPILNALVSEHDHLSSTALATLHYITYCTSYASPANLLLSNFDYALDAVSRKLNRRWLDVDATRVLAVLVRLVGRDVVQKAGDVVEECFDRLDEYHGYEVVVDGLVAVLLEVVVVIGTDEQNLEKSNESTSISSTKTEVNGDKFTEFCNWFAHHHDGSDIDATEDPGPAGIGAVPRKAWSELEGESAEQEASRTGEDPLADPPPTPTQALTQLIVSRSLYFLTHGSPLIRAKILNLLSSAAPVLPSSALLPSVHHAWPFVLNRFSDSEPYVVLAAATLVETLATHVGGFMYRRVWDDIWPRFRTILRKLEAEDGSNALARRGLGAVGTTSAHTHSHRLYTSILKTLAVSVEGVKIQNTVAWEVIVTCRRFLHAGAHEELQACAVSLYRALCNEYEDAVWLALSATTGQLPTCSFLHEPRWDISHNMRLVIP